MRKLMAIRNLTQYRRNPGGKARDLKSSVFFWGGVLFLCTVPWLGGCSSSPKPKSDPTKEEVQTDSDRFFKNLEKEESKKETKEEYP